MIFKQRRYECASCGEAVKAFAWDYEPAPWHCDLSMHETDVTGDRAPAVHDDALEGGARWCETMADQPVWLDGTKSQWRQMVEKHQVRNIVRHEQSYYDTKRKRRDEERRDTGTNAEG